MQTYEAECVPLESKCEKTKRGRPAVIAVAALVCAVMLALLALRVFSWTGKRQEASFLALVNPWNPTEFCGFEPRLTDIGGGMRADVHCAEALKQMLSDCAAAGCPASVSAAYRSADEQRELYDSRVLELVSGGLSEDAAAAAAAAQLGEPGCCEHETGLAVDLLDAGNPAMDLSQADTAAQRWLADNCRNYGFILRYPPGTEDITGMDYQPWHYRYVGAEAAEQIYQLGLTLEEYVSMFYSEEAVIVFED